MSFSILSIYKPSTFLTGTSAATLYSEPFQQPDNSIIRFFSVSRIRRGSFCGGGLQNGYANFGRAEVIESRSTATIRRHACCTSCRATPLNADGDMDENFDDIMEKYGKVVLKRGDQKPNIADDDDAESLAFAVAMAKVASDVKAGDIKVLFVKPLVYWTRFFIIMTGFSRPQIDAIRIKMGDLAEEKYGRVHSGDTKSNSWTLLDFGDVVVHIFLPEQREFYNLEDFYGNATAIELPSEDQQLRP